MDKYFAIFVGGFSLGILWQSLHDWGFAPAALAASLSLILLVGHWRKNQAVFLAASLGLIGLAAGLGRVELAASETWRILEPRIGQTTSLTGRIVAPPDRREDTTHLAVALTDWPIKVLAITGHYPEFNYGDRVILAGKLARPENFTTAGGREFDYRNYLRRNGIYYELFKPKITLVTPAGASLAGALFKFKDIFLERLQVLVPEPEMSLLAGLLVGEKQALGQSWQNAFRRAGVSHLVVLSGYNLSVVAAAILALLFFLPKFWRIGFGALAVITFAALVGGGATVVRATIMALIAMFARATGRTYAAARALIAAGLLMLLWNPLLLVFDFGFQLSFLATLGLIYFSPIFTRYFARLPARFGLRETLVITTSAQLAVLPWLLYKSGELSLVALPANLLLLPVIPATMLVGFIAGLAGLVWSMIAWPAAWLATGLLAYELTVIRVFAAWPWATVGLPLVWPLVAIIYLGLIYWCRRDAQARLMTAANDPPVVTSAPRQR